MLRRLRPVLLHASSSQPYADTYVWLGHYPTTLNHYPFHLYPRFAPTICSQLAPFTPVRPFHPPASRPVSDVHAIDVCSTYLTVSSPNSSVTHPTAVSHIRQSVTPPSPTSAFRCHHGSQSPCPPHGEYAACTPCHCNHGHPSCVHHTSAATPLQPRQHCHRTHGKTTVLSRTGRTEQRCRFMLSVAASC